MFSLVYESGSHPFLGEGVSEFFWDLIGPNEMARKLARRTQFHELNFTEDERYSRIHTFGGNPPIRHPFITKPEMNPETKTFHRESEIAPARIP